MPTPQNIGRDAATRQGFQDLLLWDSLPTDALTNSLKGTKVIDSPALSTVGAYKCFVDVHGIGAIDVTLKPHTVVGTFAPSVDLTLVDGVTAKGSAAAGANFATDTLQTVSKTGIRGERRAIVSFTIPGGGSISNFLVAEVSGK